MTTTVQNSRSLRQVVGVVVVFATAEIGFRFWLFSPGFFHFSDWMAVTLPGSVAWEWANHAQVLFIPFVLRVLYKLFGYHTWYILLLNLVLWHAGLAAIVLAVYRLTRSRHALWLLVITFWPSIWSYLPLFWKDFTFGLFVWVAAGMCLLATTFRRPDSVGGRVRRVLFWTTLAAVLFCALYWRHNAIVTVAPLCLYLTHRAVLANTNPALGSFGYLARVGLAFSAVSALLIAMVMVHPALFGKPGQKGVTRNILLHDLIGISVLSGHDLIPEGAYLPGVTFADVQAQYATTPANVDRFIFGRLLDPNAPQRLSEEWALNVRRYPKAFLRHKGRFARTLLLRRPRVLKVRELEADMRISWSHLEWFTASVHDLMTLFPSSEYKITFSPTRRAICKTTNTWTRHTNPRLVWYLGCAVAGLFLGLIWLARDAERGACSQACDRVVLSGCLFLAALATIAVIVAFAPLSAYRYAFPAVLTSISGVIALALGVWGPRPKGV